MIEALLHDAVASGAIWEWWRERTQLLRTPTWVVVFNDGSQTRMSRAHIEEFCVGLAIGSGMIPDPAAF